MKNLVKNLKKDSRGVALLWALLISMIFLVIGTSLALLVIKELRISANIDESNRAYLAAEAGMERGLYELQQKFDEDISWCSNSVLSYDDKDITGDDSEDLQYFVDIECKMDDNIKKIYIESTGRDLDRTQRKLQTRLTFIDNPEDKIDQFNRDPVLDDYYYDLPNKYIIGPLPLIIQQFDLFDLKKLDGSFEVGISENKDTSNYVNVRFEKVRANRDDGGEIINGPDSRLCREERGGGRCEEVCCLTDGVYECKESRRDCTSGGGNRGGRNSEIEVSLIGRINDEEFKKDYFSFNPEDIDVTNDSYRVKIEYARHGNFYVVARVIVLPRKLSGPVNDRREDFTCMDNDRRSNRENFIDNIIFAGLAKQGFKPAYVRIINGSYNGIDNNISLLDDGVSLDNMAFWGKK